MRRFCLFTFAGILLAATGCSRPEAPSELSWHLAGGAALKAQTNAPVLAESLSLPQSAAVVGPLSRRLAEAWWHVGTGGRPATPADLGSGIALIPDLLVQESRGAIRTRPQGGLEFAVAIRGLGTQAPAWEAAWTAWVRAMHAARGGGDAAPATLRQADWLIAVSDATFLPPAAAWTLLQEVPGDPDAVARFDVRYPGRLGLQASMTCRDGAARWAGRATLPKPLPATLPAWEIPRGIREPLVMFTAVRAVPSLIANLPWLQSWAGKVVPSELFVWGQPGRPQWGHTYFAARIEDPGAAVSDIQRRLAPLFATGGDTRFRGEVQHDPKAARLILNGNLPVVPTFEAQSDGGRGYLTFGFMPARNATNELAPEMLAQMNRSNLVYYDWEFTGAAAHHWHLGNQLVDLFEGRQAVVDSPATQWLLAAAPRMGESVTEALVTGPGELSLARKSPMGLSGFELAALAHWIDPKPPMRHRPSAAATNRPAARPKP